MKKILILFVCTTMVSLGSLHAQRLRDKRVNIKYVSLPTQVLPPEYQTYSVQVSGQVTDTRRITMDGFVRLAGQGDEYGHLRINIRTGYPQVGGRQYKTKTTTTKDKSGKETKSTTYYYTYSTSCNTSYQIIDPDGKILDSGSRSNQRSESSRHYGSSTSLRKDASAIYERIKKKVASGAVNNIYALAQKAVSEKFDCNYSVGFRTM